MMEWKEWIKNMARGIAYASMLSTSHETKHMLTYRGDHNKQVVK
jgi:hypothetical protein